MRPYFQRCIARWCSFPCWLALSTMFRPTNAMMSRRNSTNAQKGKLSMQIQTKIQNTKWNGAFNSFITKRVQICILILLINFPFRVLRGKRYNGLKKVVTIVRCGLSLNALQPWLNQYCSAQRNELPLFKCWFNVPSFNTKHKIQNTNTKYEIEIQKLIKGKSIH